MKENIQAEKANQLIESWKNSSQDIPIRTSGSTGDPKTIFLERKYMDKSANASIKALGLLPEDSFLISLSLETVGGLMLLYRAFLLNAKYTLAEPKANPLSEIENNHSYTVISLVPYQLSNILKDKSSIEKLNKFRIVLLGGADIPEELLTQIKTLKPAIFHSYGMTETYSHIALKKLNGTDAQDHFHALPGIEISTDENGRMLIKNFIENETIQTNDIARFFKENTFDIIGRYDDVIISGGIKIQLNEIEKALKTVSLLKNENFFSWYRQDEQLGQKLIVVLENKSLSEDKVKEINRELKSTLDKYKIPKEFISVPKFILTKSQKIDKIKTMEEPSLIISSNKFSI